MGNDFPFSGPGPATSLDDIRRRLTYVPNDPDGRAWNEHYRADVSLLLSLLPSEQQEREASEDTDREEALRLAQAFASDRMILMVNPETPLIAQKLARALLALAADLEAAERRRDDYRARVEHFRSDPLVQAIEQAERDLAIARKALERIAARDREGHEEQLETLQETLALTYGKLAHQMDEDLLARYDEQLPRRARIGDLFVSICVKCGDPDGEMKDLGRSLFMFERGEDPADFATKILKAWDEAHDTLRSAP